MQLAIRLFDEMILLSADLEQFYVTEIGYPYPILKTVPHKGGLLTVRRKTAPSFYPYHPKVTLPPCRGF